MKAVPGKQDVWSPWVYNEALCCMCSLSHVHLSVSVWLFTTPWTAVCQSPLSMEFSRQECWSGSPFPTPGFLPNSGIKPASLAGAGGLFFLPLSHLGSLKLCVNGTQNNWRYPGDPESLEFRTGHCNKLWRNPKTTSISSSFCSNFLCSAPVGESLAHIEPDKCWKNSNRKTIISSLPGYKLQVIFVTWESSQSKYREGKKKKKIAPGKKLLENGLKRN